MTTANKIVGVNNRVEKAISLLLSQFKDKPNITALVDALVSEVQELDNAIVQLQTARTLEGSYGVWLDEIGLKNKVERGNYNDNDYKTAIKIAMAKKTSSASVDDILRIVSLLTNDPEVTLTNDHPYLMELVGWLWCVSDSEEGLAAIAELFPVNTRVRIIERAPISFQFNTPDRGFGKGSLNSLVYTKNGCIRCKRFTTYPEGQQPSEFIPLVISPPSIQGNVLVGSLLTLSTGLWSGNTPITYTYQWVRDGFNITDATGLNYLTAGIDIGKVIACKVTATNDFGSSTFTTNTLTITTPSADSQPYNTAAPTITGNNFLGSVLAADEGTWIGLATITYTYQWYRNSEAINGATAETYTITASDTGKDINCLVVATNSLGSSQAFSNIITIAEEIPVTTRLTNDIGLRDSSKSYITDGFVLVTVTNSLTFLPNGTVVYNDDTPESKLYVSTGVGSGYTVSYSVISGAVLDGMSPNVEYSLDTQRNVSISVTSRNDAANEGRYLFTMRSTTDSADNKSMDISIAAYTFLNI